MFLRFLRYVPQSSYTLRLGIFALSFLFSGVFMVLGMVVTNNRGLTPIFAIPVALAAWMFRPRVASIAIGCIFLMLIIVNTRAVGSLAWSFPLTLTFICGALASIIVAFSIGFLRHALNVADAAHRQSQKAEVRTSISYKREQHLNELKDQFLTNVSHELRTPLTEVRGYIELLQAHHEQLEPATQTAFLDRALLGCNDLQEQVSNILDAMKIGSDVRPPHLEVVLISKLAHETLVDADVWSQVKHPLHLDIPETLAVWADQQQLRQVLRNLLSNAFKYSPPQTPVTIGAASSNIDGEDMETSSYVCISIQDTGPGIMPDDIPLLFQKFVRLERDLAGPIRGSGLGLYISKQLVEGMGGRIWVQSTGVPGQGCCFRFTLHQAAHGPIKSREQERNSG
jgi:signal transduction histidine kinase